MSIRTRTTKLLARRHDLNYFKRMSPLRAWQWYLAGGALVCAILWFSGSTVAHGDAAFSSGPISSSHAVFGQQCERCHVPVLKATRFTPSFGHSNKVSDSACLSCHNVGGHFAAESTSNPTCASCHTEHVGATHLAATSDAGCTQCHANLTSRTGALRVAAHIQNFSTDHPDFRPLRTVSFEEKNAAFALKFNHADHMKAGLSGPSGNVNLSCQSCHQTGLDSNGRQTMNMVPVSYEKSCVQCHGLEFDQHISQQAPHDYPKVVQAFVTQQIGDFAQAHPDVVASEIRDWPAQPPLPGAIKLPPPHSQGEWIANRVATSEIILWREKCALCHRDLGGPSSLISSTQPGSQPGSQPSSQASFQQASFTQTGQIQPNPDAIPMVPQHLQPSLLHSMVPISLPLIEHTQQLDHIYKAAIFSHPAHQAVSCTQCHGAALTSASGKDLLMPSISTCQSCHNGQSSPQGPPLKTGHAESGCFLCHVYHDAHGGELKSTFSVDQLTARK